MTRPIELKTVVPERLRKVHPMTIRQWLTSAALSAALGLGAVMPAAAAEKKVEYTFGSLQAVSVEAAKAQAGAWLKTANPTADAVAFAKIWADEDASVLDRTLATLELGSADAKKILADARNADRDGQAEEYSAKKKSMP